jgi:hypothetical protein
MNAEAYGIILDELTRVRVEADMRLANGDVRGALALAPDIARLKVYLAVCAGQQSGRKSKC